MIRKLINALLHFNETLKHAVSLKVSSVTFIAEILYMLKNNSEVQEELE